MKKFLGAVFFALFSLPLFSQVSDQVKEQAQVYREEGYKLQSKGDFAGALTYYQKAVQMAPYYYEAYNDVGVVYESLGDKDAAIEMYEKAISINPQYLAPYANLALLYEEEGDVEKATYYWKKRFLLGKEGEYWWYKAIEHLAKLGTYPEARKEWLKRKSAFLYKELSQKREQERLKNEEEVRLHFNIGVDLFNQENYEGAYKEFKTALSLNPLDKTLQMEISEYYAKAKKAKEKSKIKTHLEEAMSYVEEDDYESAAEKLKDALSVIFSIQD